MRGSSNDGERESHPSQPGEYHEASRPGRRGYGECVFCRKGDTAWQHDLRADRSSFRTTFGKGVIWGGKPVLCQRCETLYNGADYGALAQLQTQQPPAYEAELTDHLIGLAAFCRADQGTRALREPSFPDGFEPLAELTGAEWVIDVWPEERRRTLSGNGNPPDDDPQGPIWLVASPWPSLRLPEVFRVLWRWAEQDSDTDWSADVERTLVAQALTWSDAQALAFLRTIES